MSGFLHTFIAEVFAMVRAHVAALGGNAVVSYNMKECVFMENPNKNQVNMYIVTLAHLRTHPCCSFILVLCVFFRRSVSSTSAGTLLSLFRNLNSRRILYNHSRLPHRPPMVGKEREVSKTQTLACASHNLNPAILSSFMLKLLYQPNQVSKHEQ